MNRQVDLGRRLSAHLAAEAPNRAPDWVLTGALATIDDTQQRRVLIPAPWRYATMNSVSKLAAAAVAVVAVGILGIYALGPGGFGAQPTPTPTLAPTLAPTLGSTPTPAPPPPSPPPLTETFTSTIHGISISYPAGWLSSPATEPWTTSDAPLFQDPFADHLYDGRRTDHLFLGLSSQPLAGKTAAQWAEGVLAFDDCRPAEQVTIDGASGMIGDDCLFATVAINDRGYLIVLHTSNDEPELSVIYDRTWFKGVLATVRLHPEDANDTVPSPSP